MDEDTSPCSGVVLLGEREVDARGGFLGKQWDLKAGVWFCWVAIRRVYIAMRLLLVVLEHLVVSDRAE